MVDLPDEVRNMSLRPGSEGTRPSSGQQRSDGPSRSSGGDSRRGSDDRRSSGGRGGPRGGGRGGPRGGGRGGGPGGRRRRRRLFGGGKPCPLCIRKVKRVDYKDLETLRVFVSPHGKILPRRMSGACSSHQRMLTSAIKRARNVALLPFAYRG